MEFTITCTLKQLPHSYIQPLIECLWNSLPYLHNHPPVSTEFNYEACTVVCLLRKRECMSTCVCVCLYIGLINLF